MTDENISQKFRLKDIHESKHYFVEEMEKNKLMIKMQKKIFTILNCTGQFLILVYAVTGCISISTFASLLGIPMEIDRSATRLKVCSITAEVKKYMSIIKKKIKKHNKIVLFSKN